VNIFRILIAVFIFAFAINASAHQLSTAYLQLTLDSTGQLVGEWQVRLYDLELVIGVDTDSNGKLSWQELQDRAEVVNDYLINQLHIQRDKKQCVLALSKDWKIDSHFNEGYLLLPVRAQCALVGDISLDYTAFFAQDAEHKLLLSLSSIDLTSNRVLSESQRNIVWNIQAGDVWKTFVEFVYQGMVHIWIGLDHILFLLSLLLTCVLLRVKNAWQPQPDIKRILINAAWMVTAFTLAHSITLTMTALGVIQLSSRWVEVGIAVSVVLVALNNLFPFVLRLGWLTFGFGLLHGMGFAGVLGELGLPADHQWLTILAFNIGVEVGQMAIVIVLLPILILMRSRSWYWRYGLTITSVVILLIATQWLIERLI